MKNTFVSILIVVFELFTMFVAFCNVIVVGGIASLLLWIAPISIMLAGIKKKILYKEWVIVLTALFLIFGCLYLFRESYGGRKIIHNWQSDNKYYTVYEINPGAAGHLSYEVVTYKSIIDTDLLSVKVFQERKSCRYSDTIPTILN